ncbi:MAG: hypothetical protein HY695_21575 [Deltaproteobacteria bacterium]|nr:hypothetical protein [Deltaproteobacteria bacterium]
MSQERVSTGIAELDPHIEGGFPVGRSYLVRGEPGTGKSIFCLQFLVSGLTRGEKAIYVAVDEKPADITSQAESLGWNLSPYIDRKELLILDASAYFSSRAGPGKERQVDIDKVVGDLNIYVKRMEAARVVIDPVDALILLRNPMSPVQDPARMLVHSLRTSMATTNLLTCYATPSIGEKGGHGIEEYLVAGTIALTMRWHNGRIARSLRIEKMRATAITIAEHAFEIRKGKGITIENAS